LGLPLQALEQGFNLLTTLLAPGGFGDCLINAEEIRQVAWQRAAREAAVDPGLATLLASLPCPGQLPLPPAMASPTAHREAETAKAHRG